jgi:hypothetical protein
MKRERLDELALRREALAARAALQRIELAAAAHQLRTRSLATRGLGALALRAAGRFARTRAEPGAASARARPWMLSAGWLLVRALGRSPTARWVVAGAMLGGAVWWVARSLHSPDPTSDSVPDPVPGAAPDPASDDSG